MLTRGLALWDPFFFFFRRSACVSVASSSTPLCWRLHDGPTTGWRTRPCTSSRRCLLARRDPPRRVSGGGGGWWRWRRRWVVAAPRCPSGAPRARLSWWRWRGRWGGYPAGGQGRGRGEGGGGWTGGRAAPPWTGVRWWRAALRGPVADRAPARGGGGGLLVPFPPPPPPAAAARAASVRCGGQWAGAGAGGGARPAGGACVGVALCVLAWGAVGWGTVGGWGVWGGRGAVARAVGSVVGRGLSSVLCAGVCAFSLSFFFLPFMLLVVLCVGWGGCVPRFVRADGEVGDWPPTVTVGSRPRPATAVAVVVGRQL